MSTELRANDNFWATVQLFSCPMYEPWKIIQHFHINPAGLHWVVPYDGGIFQNLPLCFEWQHKTKWALKNKGLGRRERETVRREQKRRAHTFLRHCFHIWPCAVSPIRSASCVSRDGFPSSAEYQLLNASLPKRPPSCRLAPKKGMTGQLAVHYSTSPSHGTEFVPDTPLLYEKCLPCYEPTSGIRFYDPLWSHLWAMPLWLVLSPTRSMSRIQCPTEC